MGRFSTDVECIAQRAHVNIPEWHAAGYNGAGQVVFCDDVIKNSHHLLVKDIFETILPEATVLTGTIGYRMSGSTVLECTVTRFDTRETLRLDDFIKKYKVTILNNSTDGGNGTEVLPQAVYIASKMQQYNLLFFGAAGNGYGQPTTQKYNGACAIVSSVKFANGRVLDGLKAVGSNIDFVMFYGFQSGTSFSSPFLAGMAGLLRSKWPGITQDEVYQYLKDHCLDLGDKNKFGWGCPVMGNPAEKREDDVKVDYEKIQALLGKVPVEVDGRMETVRTINYGGENWFRLRDYDDILKIAKVDYDELRKLPIIRD